jgi:hypothetical protein
MSKVENTERIPGESKEDTKQVQSRDATSKVSTNTNSTTRKTGHGSRLRVSFDQ